MKSEARPVHRRFVAHLARCRHAEYARFCQLCFDLERDASAEAWRIMLATKRSQQPIVGRSVAVKLLTLPEACTYLRHGSGSR